MPERRFPKRKYLRQIADMESDFGWWMTEFQDVEEHAWPPGVALRAGGRVEVLRDARRYLHELYHTLEALPRLK